MPYYEDVTLDTPDNIKIRAYLIVQRTQLPRPPEGPDDGMERAASDKVARSDADDEVCATSV